MNPNTHKALEDTIRLANRLAGNNLHSERAVAYQFERFLREMERREGRLQRLPE